MVYAGGATVNVTRTTPKNRRAASLRPPPAINVSRCGLVPAVPPVRAIVAMIVVPPEVHVVVRRHVGDTGRHRVRNRGGLVRPGRRHAGGLPGGDQAGD